MTKQDIAKLDEKASKFLKRKVKLCMNTDRLALDRVYYEVQRKLKDTTGGQAMTINYGQGFLVRFLVPTLPGGKYGRYSEGVNADYGTALAQALAGLNQ